MQGIQNVTPIAESNATLKKSETDSAQQPDSKKDSAEISSAGREALKKEEQKKDHQNELTHADEVVIKQLEERDREVRQHELAHKAAGGAHTRGGPHYEYTTGPDGQRYATGGHVNIDVSKMNSPQSTIRKMDQVRRAALAPAEPSAQDRIVASQAIRTKQAALLEIKELELEEQAKLKEAQEAKEAEDDETDDEASENSINITA